MCMGIILFVQARERRDGQNKDYEQTEMMSTTADYRAVAPDVKSYVITNVVRHFQFFSIYDLKSERYQFHGNNDIAHFSNCISFYQW